MSISAILKADIKKQNAEALAEFLSKGGVVRKVPTPTFYSEAIRWANTYGKGIARDKMKNAIAVSCALTKAKAAKR